MYFIFIACLAIVAAIDAINKKIPNALSLLIIILGLGGNVLVTEGLGFRSSIAGSVIGLLCMLPGYVLATMGAGDVKLIAAIGSVVGVEKVLNVVYFSYLSMFVMAIVFIIVKGDFFRLLCRIKTSSYHLLTGRLTDQNPSIIESLSYRLPLAPPIVFATIYVIYPKMCSLRMLGDLCAFSLGI